MFLKRTSLLINSLNSLSSNKTFFTKCLSTYSKQDKLVQFSNVITKNNRFYRKQTSFFTAKKSEEVKNDKTEKEEANTKKEKNNGSQKEDDISLSEEESVSIERFKELKKDYIEMATKTEQYKKKFEEIRKAYLENKEETEQMRKRLEKENQQIKEYAITKFSKDLLDVCDNFDRALTSIKDKDFDKLSTQEKIDLYNNFIEGVKMTQNVLANSLKKHGISEYSPLNEKFDPNKHDAVFDYIDEEKTPGTVGTVINCGYLISDRVLRPAKVGIIKKTI